VDAMRSSSPPISEMSEVGRVADAAGEIDVLVNCAGFAALAPTTDIDEAAPQPEPTSTVVEQSERNAMVILNLTCFPTGTYLCAGRRI
jgi:NAD(P)-dependent dehydrogenase (short-subunit alcohol dehydrogenase family)